MCQEPLQQVTHCDGAVDVEHHCHIPKEDHNDVEHIPETLEVLQLMFLDLKDLFDGIVYDKEDEDPLAGHHKVVECGDVANQLHCAEVE